MMILRSAPPSPFGRKVKIAAHQLGLIDQIRIEAADTLDPNDVLRTQNPLGKIPVLILSDGTALYDSRVILDYLDHLAGGGRLFPAGPGRFETLTRMALADGITDAALLQVYEVRFRAEGARSEKWVDHQTGKVERGLAALETSLAPLEREPDAGDIATACMLGYLDLRFSGKWRARHPRLVEWLADFEAAVPSFDLTRPPG
jgi:glutathione S-transferase